LDVEESIQIDNIQTPSASDVKTHGRVLCILGPHWAHQGGSVRPHDHDLLGLSAERGDPCRWLWIKVVQPIKEIHQHFQRALLAGLHRFTQFRLRFLHILVILDLDVLLLERDRVAEEELRGVFDHVWESIS